MEAGDIFEWWEADDCFVRYTVTDVKDDPTGDPPRKLLAVAWMTYAFTGCSGAISSTATASLQFGPLPALGGTSLTAPIVHGMTQIVPEDWTGALMEPVHLRGDSQRSTPVRRHDRSGHGAHPPPLARTPVARWLDFCRERRVSLGSLYASVFGYCAWYRL